MNFIYQSFGGGAPANFINFY